jgi:hypothetical protein
MHQITMKAKKYVGFQSLAVTQTGNRAYGQHTANQLQDKWSN